MQSYSNNSNQKTTLSPVNKNKHLIFEGNIQAVIYKPSLINIKGKNMDRQILLPCFAFMCMFNSKMA